MNRDATPALVETPPFAELPDALVSDTSFLSMVGRSGNRKREAVVEYVTDNDKTLYLTERVAEELKRDDADEYGRGDWLYVARREDWMVRLPAMNEGIRIHDGPRASEIIDRTHERIAKLEKVPQDEVKRTDPALGGRAIQLLGAYDYDRVGIVIKDRNAERALSAVLSETFYEELVHIFRGEDVVMELKREYEEL
ncbi:hypothetical protein NGM10_10485 [Halorussus salilacus]|uniref:hypothetical protein n=1 Tax=Halorussus salilacus TaxID=2953750 RepID=UPI00209EC953|nr:hypothetical protein [Halorussus salilacus]USZ67157.1 hypothetical protein NGM10_10485 [Halorussus salilacus]